MTDPKTHPSILADTPPCPTCKETCRAFSIPHDRRVLCAHHCATCNDGVVYVDADINVAWAESEALWRARCAPLGQQELDTDNEKEHGQ